uniref:Formylmethanofuran dehydrogenase n=1 Tax=candidate division WOR-3 bacterium TaxID=2052148 RepID=A0A7C1NBF0_UNCW3
MAMTPLLKNAARFHGHLGPWLVVGLRAGIYARRRFKCTPFQIRATIFCPPKPPVRCVIDGIQLGAGCTMGKGNIRHRTARRFCRIHFSAPPRRQLTLSVRPEVFNAMVNLPSDQVKQLALQVARMPLKRIFAVKPYLKPAV